MWAKVKRKAKEQINEHRGYIYTEMKRGMPLESILTYQDIALQI